MGTPDALHEVDVIAEKMFIFWKKMNEIEVHRNINTLKRLMASAPLDTCIIANRIIGLLYVRNKLYDQAITHFRVALDLIQKHGSQDNGTLVMDIGDALYKAGRFQEALEYALKASDQMGESSWKITVLLLNTAQALHGLGRWDDALELYHRALDVANQEDPGTLFWLAEVSATLQYFDESLGFLSRLLTIRYGASTLPPLEYVESFADELELPASLVDMLDFQQGRRDQLRLMPDPAAPDSAMPADLQETTLAVMDAFASARERATLALFQQGVAHAE